MTRSRWRASRATSRRAASRTSTMAASCGSVWRTAAVMTLGTPTSRASASMRPAWPRLPGWCSGPPWHTTSTTTAPAREQRDPALERRPGAVAPLGEHRAADVGVGSEEHDEPGGSAVGHRWRMPSTRPSGRSSRAAGGRTGSGSTARVLGDEARGRDGVAALAAQVGRGDEAAERRPPLARGEAGAAAAGQHGDAREPGVDEGAAAHRGAHGTSRWRSGCSGPRARSTPRIGATSCSMQERTNFTAP